MDVIELWELFYDVDNWSFETFPWEIFTLCSTPVDQDATIFSALQTKQDNDLLSTFSLNGSSNENISSIHVPPEDVPSHQVLHSNETSLYKEEDKEESANFQNALKQSESAETIKTSSFISDGLEIDETLISESLEESIQFLRLSLGDRSTLAAFEKLTKRKPQATMNAAKLPENMPKNRYKDVLPYDDSRVILTDWNKGDYINASFVNMKIPHLKKVNEYIATQGPLPTTCEEFWQMVWEQKCSIIVMVTTLKERNRVKCHKYWPDLYDSVIYGSFQITCYNEISTRAGITRDLLLINDETNEERHVIQMQHVTWPDHGVPQDATDFLNFVQQLREHRTSKGGKVVVHCSAGVGRTGVFILMETVMCLIEAGKPIYPIDLVKTMRDQRVMMVQTVSQYKFICEAILKIYSDYQAEQSVSKAR